MKNQLFFRTHFLVFLAVAAVIVLSACCKSREIPGTYVWMSYGPDTALQAFVVPAGSPEPVFTFTNDSFIGSTTCNTVNGSYTTSACMFEVSNFASTRAACSDALTMTLDDEFKRLIEQVSRYSVSDSGTLKLYTPSDEVLVFVPHTP